MLKVDSRRSIKKLAQKSLKANKKRNLVLILAIVLTAFLLTSVFSIGISYVASARSRNLRTSGMASDGELTDPTKQQVQTARQLPSIRHAGYLAGCGGIAEYQKLPTDVMFRWVDTTCWQQILKPAKEYVVGHYPRQRTAIMLSKKALDKLKIKQPKIGMKLTFTYNNTLGEKTETFTLSGWYKDYTGKQLGFVSTPFFKEAKVPVGDPDSSRLYLQLKNPVIAHKAVRQLEKQLGVAHGQVLFMDTQLGDELPVMLAGGGVLVLLIMLCGYLVIYNVLYISVTRDIQYYGLLKTVGVTPRQIRQVLVRQVGVLLAVAVPAGLVSGALVSLGIVPQLVKTITGIPAEVSFHPAIFLGAALFAVITTVISMRRPLRLARRISPIEAAKYQSVGKRKTVGHRPGGVKLWRLAARNLFREKKKAVVVFLSLIVGMAAFVCFLSVLKTNDARNILNQRDCDLTVENNTMRYPERVKDPQPAVPRISPEIIAQIKSVPGVRDVAVTTANKVLIPEQRSLEKVFSAMFDKDMLRISLAEGRTEIKRHPERYWGYLTGIDEEGFKDLQKDLSEPVDKQAFLAGQVAIFSDFPQLGAAYQSVVHQPVTYALSEEQGQPPHSIQIAALSDDELTQLSGFWSNLIVSQKLAQKLLPEPMVESVSVDYKRPYDKVTEAKVKAVISRDRLLKYESKLDDYNDMQGTESQLKIFGGGLMLILTLLGLMNYVNMMITSLQNRKTELAILHSLGMTKRQQQQTLALEGLGYGLISGAAAVLVGTGLGYFFYRSMPVYDGLTYQLPGLVIGLFFAGMLAFCTVLPVWLYRRTNTGSIVEELRSRE